MDTSKRKRSRQGEKEKEEAILANR